MCLIIKMDPEYEYHEFYLDSADAKQAYTEGYTVRNWPLFQLPFQLTNIESFKVLEVQIPVSYCVTKGASFQINYYAAYTGTPGLPITKTIPLPTIGTLSGTGVASYLTTQLQINQPLLLNGWGGNYIKCTFVPSSTSITGLPYFLFETTAVSPGSPTDVNQDFEIIISQAQAESLLGYPMGTTRCDQFGVVGIAVKTSSSPRPTLITGPPYMYVSSNTIGNLCKTFLPQGASLLAAGVSSPQIAKLPVNAAAGSWIQWSDTNAEKWFSVDNIATLSQLDLYCQLGNYGGQIDFQGLSFSIKLGVLLKRKDRITQGERGGIIKSQPFGYTFDSISRR